MFLIKILNLLLRINKFQFPIISFNTLSNNPFLSLMLNDVDLTNLSPTTIFDKHKLNYLRLLLTK